jgi:hypothetical protein
MASMPRLMRLAAAVLLALVVAGSALAARADHLDPQERFTSADQARARAMLLKRADVAAGATSNPGGSETHTTCRALDESDLVLTGEAHTPEFGLPGQLSGLISFQSVAQVYRSAAHASASWKRANSAAGFACLRAEFRKLGSRTGVQFYSLRKLRFPRLAQRTVAYRALYTGQSQGRPIRVYFDAIYLGRSRALAGIFIASALGVFQQKDEARLARLVAGRMAKALRAA